MKKTLRWFGSGFISFILLSLLLLVTVAFSEAGSRILLNTLSKITPLEIQYSGGSLLGGLQLSQLRLANDNIEVELTNVNAKLDASCLWLSRICFNELSVAQLQIDILPSKEDAQAKDSGSTRKRSPAELFVFPYPVEVVHLNIGKTYIHWQNGLWRHGQSAARVSITGSKIVVDEAHAEDSYLELRESLASSAAAGLNLKNTNPKNTNLQNIDLPVELLINKLAITRPNWNFYGYQHQQQALNLSGRWLNTQLQIKQVEIDDASWGNIDLSGNIEFVADWPIHATAMVEPMLPPGWKGFHERTFNLDISGDLGTLVIDAQSKSDEQIKLTGTLNTLNKDLPFTLQANARWSNSLPLHNFPGIADQLPRQLAGINLLSPWQLSAKGDLQSQSFHLSAAAQGLNYKALQLSLSGRHKNAEILLEQVELRDTADNPDTEDSTLTLNGKLFFGEPLQWSLIAKSPGFDLPAINETISGHLLGELQASGSSDKDSWLLALDNVDLQGDINQLPATISGYATIQYKTIQSKAAQSKTIQSKQVQYETKKASLNITRSNLFAELNDARLTLKTDESLNQSLQFNLNIIDLSRWHKDGAGSLAVQSSIDAHTTQMTFDAKSQDLQWKNIVINQAKIEGNINLKNLSSFTPPAIVDQSFALDISLDTIKVDSTQLRDVSIIASNNEQGQSLSLSSQGFIEGNLELKGKPAVAGGGSLWGDGWQGRLLPTTLATPIGQWQLAESVRLDWDLAAQQLKIAPHCWHEDKTQLCSKAISLGKKGGGRVELDGDISFLHELFPEDITLQGQLSASFESHWAATGNTSIKGELALQSGQITQSLGIHESATMAWDKADLHFSQYAEGLQLGASFIQAGNKTIAADLKLPIGSSDAMAGSLVFSQLQLSNFKPFAPKLSKLQGQVDGTILLSGNIERPQGHGIVRVSDGQIGAVINPGEITDIGLELNLQGDWAKLRGQGRLGGGDLNITGKVFSQPEPRLALNLQGNKQTVLIPPSSQLLVSENLQLSANDKLLELTGMLTVHEGQVKFEELPEEGVALSPDVIKIDSQGKPLKQHRPFDTALDLRISIADQLKVTGRGLNIEVGGDLHLLQKPRKPLQLFGDLNILGGELQAYGQRLLVKRGNVSFVGAPENPALDVRAEREISNENVSVGVEVQGTLETPILQTYSDPTMSQTEALSYLVRGRGLTSGAGAQTGNDGANLALSLGTGLVNQSGLLTGFNEIPGISNVELGTADSANETKATVSGYLGDRLYLSYGVGLYEPINVLTSRFYLRTRLWLEIVSSLENSLDLYYSFDID